MELKPGDKLGPYEVVSPLGKGGMGEVWKAHDSRLNRDVAIKVSAKQFTDRFEREARAIAALNHPNICTLFDVGPDYLVMELIEGPTLAYRIAQGPIPPEEALAIAKQIADALEAAHDKAIVHRDLKPANVKIRPDGSVKVLDFGLAKAVGEAKLTPDSPTVMPETHAGMILGSAGYMSPEQARGQNVDKRADIWSFGVVLYEMLTGKRLFDGATVSDSLAGILKEDPDLTPVPANTRRLLQRCLQKDPKKRLRDIGEAMAWLEAGKTFGFAEQVGGLFHKKSWIAALLVVTVALGVWALWRALKPADRPLMRLDVDLGSGVALPPPNLGGSDVALSPDGTRLVYTTGAPPKLFTRRLDQASATELPGTQGATLPFFSPDGQWIGFTVGNKLSKISVEGGDLVPLLALNGIFAGASWGEDNTIIVSEGLGRGLLRIPAGGGTPVVVAPLGKGELSLALPQILPGGKAILYEVFNATGVNHTIEVLTLANRRRKIVLRDGSSPRYLATSNKLVGGVGHLVYANKATLFAVPFDPAKLESRGTPVPVLDDVAYMSATGTAQFYFSGAPSGHGTLVYRRTAGGAAAITTLQWAYPTEGTAGKNEPLRAKPGVYSYPSISPDGKSVALSVTGGANTADIWVYDLTRDAMTRLTFGGSFYFDPIWSPNGRYVVFSSVGNGIFQAQADGSGQPRELTQNKSAQALWSFTPDGKRLAYYDLAGNDQIWTVPLEDQGGELKAGTPEQFLKSSYSEQFPAFSPDGRWLAYESDETGKDEIYVRAFPQPAPGTGLEGQGRKWQVSNNGGALPHWSRGGHDLMYLAGDQIMAASYTRKGDAFVLEKPRVWIAKPGIAPSDSVSTSMWDLAPDGKRVLVLTSAERAEAPKAEHEIAILQNFFDELRRKVPAEK